MNGDVANSGFDESSGHQSRLSEQVPSIAVANRGRFLTDIQSISSLSGRHQREGALPEGIEAKCGPGSFQSLSFPVELFQQ